MMRNRRIYVSSIIYVLGIIMGSTAFLGAIGEIGGGGSGSRGRPKAVAAEAIKKNIWFELPDGLKTPPLYSHTERPRVLTSHVAAIFDAVSLVEQDKGAGSSLMIDLNKKRVLSAREFSRQSLLLHSRIFIERVNVPNEYADAQDLHISVDRAVVTREGLLRRTAIYGLFGRRMDIDAMAVLTPQGFFRFLRASLVFSDLRGVWSRLRIDNEDPLSLQRTAANIMRPTIYDIGQVCSRFVASFKPKK